VFGFGAVELEYAGGYVGWVMAYDKATLAQTGAFATVTTGNRGGGVWQSGRPPVVDSSGFVYVYVGNAYGNGYDGVQDFSESVLKLDPANGLKLVDWFTPGNWSTLDTYDADLTSSGPLLIPGTSLIAGGGKTGVMYVLNTANLGKFNSSDSQVVQKLPISTSELRGGLVYWQRSSANGGPLMYDWGVSDRVKAYQFNGSTFAITPSAQGGVTNQVFPGGFLALSANSDTPGTGVLWATVATSGDAENNPPVPGALYAFDAGNVATELWDSTMNAARDSFGNFAKFVPPLVANGRVYVATWSNQVVAYGLLGATVTSVSPRSGSTTGGTAVSVAGTNFVSGATVSFGGAAAGAVVVVSPTKITASTPPHKQGAVTVVVTNPSGQTGALPGGFTYRKP
jgi:IPT/TIG domain-containing protein